MIVDTSGGHEVAFVSGIDEHAAGVSLAAEHGDGSNVAILERHAFFAVEPFVAMDGDLVFFDEVLEDLFGDAGFENPHRAFLAIDGAIALAFVAILFLGLPLPGLVLVVVEEDAVIELAGESADDFFFAGVSPAESAGAEAAEVFVGGDDDD